MPPIVHCVRHAQGYHNLNVESHSLPDPLLTELGKKQCSGLMEKFPFHSDVELVVASPLRRTIYTALLGFKPVFEKHSEMKLIALSEAQESADVPCDTGSDLAVLKKEFDDSGLPVDLSLIEEGWNTKTGKWAPTAMALMNRAREARQWVKARPEKEIVLVSHGGFLHYFTDDWEDSSFYQGTGWTNTEFRTYQFSDIVDTEDLEGYTVTGDNAIIVETPESRKRRGKSTEAPSREEQKALYRQGMAGWVSQGLQPSSAERRAGKVPEGKEINGVRV